MSRRADSLKGNGRGIEPRQAKAAPVPPTAPAASASGELVVEFSQAWGALLTALRDGKVKPWCPLADAARGSITGPRPDLLLTVKRGGEPGGYFFARPRAAGVIEVRPLLTLRGQDAIEAGRVAVRKLFVEGPATAIFLGCPVDHPEALSFARGCGLRPAGQRAGLEFFRLDLLAWLEEHRGEFRAEGETFRRLVFVEDNSIDPLRDSVVGACLAMARHDPDKGLGIWDASAILFGFEAVEPVVTTPELVVWRQAGAVIALTRATGNLTLLHRP